MNQEQKIEKLVDCILSDDLSEYRLLLKNLKRKLPFFTGSRNIAAALLKQHLGDISNLDLTLNSLHQRAEDGKVLFEDIKDGKARLFINIGKNQKISPGDLIREIVKRSGIDGKFVGKIDIHSTYSFFEIPEKCAELVLVSLDKSKIRGVTITVEPAKRRRKGKDNDE